MSGLFQSMVSRRAGWARLDAAGQRLPPPAAAACGVSAMDTGRSSARGFTNSFHVSVKRSREGMGQGNERPVAAVSSPPAGHELRHMPEATLGYIQLHKYPDQFGHREEDGGILLHGLYLLVANERQLGNPGDLVPTGLGQRG